MQITILGNRSSIHIVRWANALAERGYRIDLLSMHSPFESLNKHVNVIQLPHFNPGGYFKNIPFVRKQLRHLKPNILHSFYAFGYGFLGRMTGFHPHIISVMGSDVYDDPFRNRLYKKIIANNIRDATHICSTSHVMKEQIEKLEKCTNKITVTPFGVDTNFFRPKKRLTTVGYDFVIGTVKVLKPKYGVDVLIKAFCSFCNLFPRKNFKLILIGSGTHLEEYRKLTFQLGVGEHCEFVGLVDHNKVPNWLNLFDVFVALSRYNSESFGVAVLEAMASGVPVITSDVGGLPEIIQHNKNGLIVAKEDVKAATEAMCRLYKDKVLRNKLSVNGRAHVISRYDWNCSVEKMVNIYKQVIIDEKPFITTFK